MADTPPHPAGHPTDRLLGASPAIAALRAQIRHLASFDTVGSPHVPTLLLQGKTGSGKGLVARVMHDEDILLLARNLVQHYAGAHGLSPKRLNAEAEAWLQGYAWPRNVRELSHVMERVTLLHVGTEVDAETLTRLCLPLSVRASPAGVIDQPRDSAPEGMFPAEAEQIRQALLQTGGNVARAARLLEVSRDTVRYRMQRYGIERPRRQGPSPATSPLPLDANARRLSPPGEGPPARLEVPQPSPLSRPDEPCPQELVPPPDAASDSTTPLPIPSSVPAWEQAPVAVLALELTRPKISALESLRYDPWTDQARWEQMIADKVRGFEGTLMQHTASSTPSPKTSPTTISPRRGGAICTPGSWRPSKGVRGSG